MHTLSRSSRRTSLPGPAQEQEHGHVLPLLARIGGHDGHAVLLAHTEKYKFAFAQKHGRRVTGNLRQINMIFLIKVFVIGTANIDQNDILNTTKIGI